MKRKATFELGEEAYQVFEKALEEANRGFEAGKIHPSTLISEMILSAKIDYEDLRLKNIDLKKYLYLLAENENVDPDAIVSSMKKLKGIISKQKGEMKSSEEA